MWHGTAQRSRARRDDETQRDVTRRDARVLQCAEVLEEHVVLRADAEVLPEPPDGGHVVRRDRELLHRLVAAAAAVVAAGEQAVPA